MSFHPKKCASVLVCLLGLSITVPSDAGEVTQPVNADLSSSERIVTAGNEVFGSGATQAVLNVGGEQRVVQTGDMVTLAEYAALSQVLSFGQQHLQLDAQGRATGGSLVLSALATQNLTNLVIPSGVTAVGGITGDSINLAGNIINNGTLLALTSSGQNFSIASNFLTVGPGASITTSVPTSLASLFAQSSIPINLSIFTQSGILNSGTIAASGILSITSNGTITNALPSGVVAPTPVMNGVLGTIMQSATGIINNSGIIGSTGNIQFSANRDLLINNLNGIISTSGAVNISQLDSSFKGSTSVIGGSIFAETMNINGADGIVKALVSELRAPITVTGAEAHIAVTSGSLNIAEINLTGDPTFVNSGGDIILNANSVDGALRYSGMDLAVLASGSVIAGAGLTAIDLSSATGDAGSLTIAAGFDVTPGTGGLTLTEPPTGPLTYTIGAASASGGSILLNGVMLDTSSTAGDGGTVTLVAHDNDALNQIGTQGAVEFGQIHTSSNNGSAGNLLIVAQSGVLNVNAPIDATGVTSGAVEIFSGEPEPAPGLEFFNGTMTGTFRVKGDPTHAPVALNLFAPIIKSSNVAFNTSGDVLLNAPILADGDVDIVSRVGAIGIATNIAAENIAVAAETDVLLLATLVGQSDVTIAAGGNINDFGSVIGAITGDLSMFSGNMLNIAPTTNLLSGNDIILASDGGIDIGNNAVVRSLGSTLMITNGGINIGPGVQLKSGQLETVPPTGLLSYNDVFRFGGIFLLAENSINLQSSMESNGLDMLVLSRSGDITMAPGTNYVAHGGTIAFHAGGKVLGNNNTFYSRAAGSLSDFGGGAIELSSGFSFNPIVLSFGDDAFNNQNELLEARGEIGRVALQIDNLAKNPEDQGFMSPELDNNNIVLNPNRMGNNVEINGNGFRAGLVLPVEILGGTVDVSNSQLNMRRGAVVLTAVGAGSRVDVQNSSFNTESYAVFPTDYANADLPALVQSALKNDVDIDANFLKTIFTADAINQPTARHISLGGKLSGSNERSSAAMRAEANLLSAMRFVGALGFVADPSAGMMVDTRSTGYVRTETVNVTMSHTPAMNTALGIMGSNTQSYPMIKVSDSRSDLMLFTTTGQVLNGDIGGSKKASAIGARGTALSMEDEELVLHSGKVYANSGQGTMLISTSFGKLRLVNGASAAVISEPGKPARVVTLGGPAGAQVELTPASRSAEPIILLPGEQAVIEIEKIADAGDQSRMVIVKGRAPLSQLMAGEQFNPGRGILLSGSNRQAYDRLLARMSELARQQGGGFEPARQLVHSRGFGEPDAPVRLLAADGSIFQQLGDGSIDLHSGSMFVASNTPQTIKANHAEVTVAEQGMVTVESGRSKTRVLAFSGPGHTSVKANGRTFDMLPGEDLLIQIDRPTKADALPADGIARRKMTFVNVPKGGAVMADFSIASAISARPYLKSLVRPQVEGSEQLLASLMKTHTVVEMVTGRRGRFFMKPQETASCPDWIYEDDMKQAGGALAQK